MRYEDDKGNEYKVGQYLGNDPEKRGMYHVCKIDRHYNRRNIGSEKTNPWVPDADIASDNLRILAKKYGWKKV